MAAHLTHVFARHNSQSPQVEEARRRPANTPRNFGSDGLRQTEWEPTSPAPRNVRPSFLASPPFARVFFLPFQQKARIPSPHFHSHCRSQKTKSSNAAQALPFHLTARKFFIWFFTSSQHRSHQSRGRKHFSGILAACGHSSRCCPATRSPLLIVLAKCSNSSHWITCGFVHVVISPVS